MPITKVVILMGSRNPDGHTGRAAKALMEGLAERGVQAEQIWLLEHNLERCMQRGIDGFGGCLAEGHCLIQDDFGAIVERIRAAELVVFATPVYWGDLSEITRAFLDRLRRTCLHEEGKRGIQGKMAVGLCVAGGGGGGALNCADSLQRVLSHCEFDVLDVVPARRQNLDLKLEVLRATGRWLGERDAP
jgi:multimeric flavodoxin WrbA